MECSLITKNSIIWNSLLHQYLSSLRSSGRPFRNTHWYQVPWKPDPYFFLFIFWVLVFLGRPILEHSLIAKTLITWHFSFYPYLSNLVSSGRPCKEHSLISSILKTLSLFLSSQLISLSISREAYFGMLTDY